MLYISIIFILLLLKILLYIKIYNLKINKILLNFINICISYEITSDLAQIMIEFEVIDRPWWFNIFLGTGVLNFLSKNHAIRNIFLYLNKEKVNKKTNFLFIFFSTLFGIIRLYFYIKYFIDNNYTRDMISNEMENKFELYSTSFALNFYNFFLIIPPMIIFIKNLNNYKNNKFSIKMKKEYSNFFYLAILPKTVLDLLVTRFFGLAIFLFYGGAFPLYSLILSFFVNFCSIYFFY